ncbi:lipocalin family protein [Salegentibacter sp. HM20]
MKKSIFVIFSLVLLVSCQKQDASEQMKHLTGYWEIDRVEVGKDSIRDYSYNPTIDYLEIKEDSTGFRKKLQPQIDGSYLSTEDSEEIKLKLEDDSLRIYYTTAFDSWKETVLKANEEELSILNRDGLIYHYKKYKALIDYEEEKN